MYKDVSICMTVYVCMCACENECNPCTGLKFLRKISTERSLTVLQPVPHNVSTHTYFTVDQKHVFMLELVIIVHGIIPGMLRFCKSLFLRILKNGPEYPQ